LIVSNKSSFLGRVITHKDYNLHLDAKPKTPSLPPETMGYLFFIYLFRYPTRNHPENPEDSVFHQKNQKKHPKTLAKHAKKQLSKTPRGVTDKGALPDNMIHFKP